MADEADGEIPEETPDPAEEAEGGEAGEDADSSTPSEEPADEATNAEESLTPHRAAKLAGIMIGTVLVCAAVVVAAVWAIVAIVDDDDDDDDEYFFEEAFSPAALDDDGDERYDGWSRGYQQGRGYEKQPFGKGKRWNWSKEDHSLKPGGSLMADECETILRFGVGPDAAVVLICGGSSAALGDLKGRDDFGFGGLRGGSGNLLPFMLPFFEDELPFGSGQFQFFEGEFPLGSGELPFKGELPFGSGELQFFEGELPFGSGELPAGEGLEGLFSEPDLEVRELDNEAPEVVAGLTPT